MSKRFECHREPTGRIIKEKKMFGLIEVMYEEWLVLTNLLSNDITDEWHLEYKRSAWRFT